MIPFDVIYRRPDSLEEAVAAWRLDPEGSLYYGGGTEILTGARGGTHRFSALVDIKGLAECRELGRRRTEEGDCLYFGAGLSLNEVVESGAWPILSRAARRVADHTVRNRLTLGGNVAGRLPYREALLPFLAADGNAWLAGPAKGGGVERRTVPLRRLHEKRLLLEPGEFILGLSVPASSANLPSYHDRATAGAEIDYPLVALVAIATSRGFSVALSGYRDSPLLVESPEGLPKFGDFPAPRSDFRAGSDYRAALLEVSLERAAKELL